MNTGMGGEPCVLCDRMSRQSGAEVCSQCVDRVAMFVLTTDLEVLARFWPLLSAKQPSWECDEIIWATRGAVTEVRGAGAKTHADLAMAFAEMGLMEDATGEAVAALCMAGSDRQAATAALAVLLQEQVAGRDVVSDLKGVMRRRGWS